MSKTLLCASALTLVLLTGCKNADSYQDTTNTSIKENANALEVIEPKAEALQTGLAGENPADIARYLMARGAGQAKLSPDGETIAFRYGITGNDQIWTLPISGGQAQQTTFGNGVTFFEWAPRGKSLIYGADNNGNEQESYYALDLAKGLERELLPAVKGGFRSFGGFSSDGTKLAFASTERNGLDFDIYLADSTSGTSKRIYDGKYGNYVQAVSPDASQLVVSETVGEDSDNIYLLDAITGERKILSKPELSNRANHTDGGMNWSVDGEALYFATNKGREFAALTKYVINSGEYETLYEEQADVGNVVLCGPDDRYIAFTTNHDGFEKLHITARQSGVEIKLSGLPDGVYGLSCSPQSNTLLARVGAYNRPGDLYTIDMRTGAAQTVFQSSYAGLDPARMIKPVSVRLPASDGVEIQGLLYLPDAASRGDAKPPVVFRVHGGPTAQARPSYRADIQYLVDQGIAVFETNVRGSTGFGRKYVTLDDREKRLDSVRDLIDMLAYLKTDGRVDTDRAAVMGGSYGGYMVNAVLAEYPEAFKAGVSLYGVADWVTALEVASPALKAADLVEYGDINDPKWREFYTENSPIRQADKIKVPVLFSHGVMDPRIDIAETETMVKALRANGIEAPFIRIPDEGHGWRKLSNQLFYNRRQAEFLLEHLGE